MAETDTTIASVAITRGAASASAMRCGQDVDDVPGAHQIQDRVVGQVQRHDPGIRAGGGLRQPRTEQPDVGDDLTAPHRPGDRRADDRPGVGL